MNILHLKKKTPVKAAVVGSVTGMTGIQDYTAFFFLYWCILKYSVVFVGLPSGLLLLLFLFLDMPFQSLSLGYLSVGLVSSCFL